MRSLILFVSFLVTLVSCKPVATETIMLDTPFQFNSNGKFKIAQFTDVHYIHSNPKSAESLEVIDRVLSVEKPDLIIFTGDVVTGTPVQEGWDAVMGTVERYKIPFVVVFGNHDDENGLNRTQLHDIIRKYTYNRNQLFEDKSAVDRDFIIPINDRNKKVANLLYCMDSHAYSNIDTVPGYAWFSFDQVQWYRNKSNQIQKSVGKIPALAFFHIPLPEYTTAALHDTTKLIGVRGEVECSPKINTGLFAAFVEMDDVRATFCGHDHSNDYIATLFGKHLIYGRCTAGETTYRKFVSGARLIELEEGSSKFTTWTHDKNGIVENIATF